MNQGLSFARLILALVLSPFSMIYGIIISIRNILYDAEIIKPTKFSIPLISVGNLAIGGAGKTPHIEYLTRLLSPYLNVSILSRGYNRETMGFRFVSPRDMAKVSGDEPLMYARKFEDVIVAVGENRALAIPKILQHHPHVNLVLLDDAFQHLSVTPYINILLTQYESLYTYDYLMPSGRLREWRSSYRRATAIIVSKCPEDLNEEQRAKVIKRLKPLPNQKVFFTKYTYEDVYHFYDPRYRMQLDQEHQVLLISAIANTNYLKKYLDTKGVKYLSMEYADHHNFTQEDIDQLINNFTNHQAARKYILTTEKDAVRLLPYRNLLYEKAIPVYVLPIHVGFIGNDKALFDEYIKSTLLEFEV
jgi:tetraacyldisaccharide 4'-kinase